MLHLAVRLEEVKTKKNSILSWKKQSSRSREMTHTHAQCRDEVIPDKVKAVLQRWTEAQPSVMFVFVCKDNSKQGGVGTGYGVCVVRGEQACVDNVFTVYFSGDSCQITVNPPKNLILKAQNSKTIIV